MKKLIALFVVCGLLLGVAYTADAATKKVVTKKKVVKKAAPKKVAPKKVAPRPVAPIAPVAPIPAPRPVAPIPTPVKTTSAGAFGWGLNSDISGTYLYNGKGPASGAMGVRMDLVFSDPMAFGTWVGLSADAVKYKVGLGGFYGKDNYDKKIYALPLYVDGVIMLPAALLGGVDSYIGGGVNYALYGTGKTTGTYGGQVYYGIMGDLGLGLGKTALEIGYGVVRAGTGTGKRSAKGLTISVSQPFVL
ncbi:MAG: hypothetical protein WCV91_03905 [Candidatus Margulisiibacteriota bacterium]